MNPYGLVVLLCLPVVGCGDDNPTTATLSGSLSRIYSLETSNTRARQSGDQMSIEFRNRDGAVVTLSFGTDIVTGTGVFKIPTPIEANFPQYDNPNFDLKATGGQLTLTAFSTEPDSLIQGRFEASVVKDALVTTDVSNDTVYSVIGRFETTVSRSE